MVSTHSVLPFFLPPMPVTRKGRKLRKFAQCHVSLKGRQQSGMEGRAGSGGRQGGRWLCLEKVGERDMPGAPVRKS